MHSLWIFFLRKRAFTYLLMFVLTLAGLYCLVAIPKESSPEVIIPMGIVTTVLRGGSAEDVERLVTDKLENELANLENLDVITSSSLEGVSSVSVQFLASADIDRSIQDLKDAVDRAKVEFPEDATEPSVMRVNFADQPILILSVSQDLSPASFAALGDDLEKELKKVSGVSKVSVSGTRERETQVVLRKEMLEAYGLRADQVVSALALANASFPIGSLTVSGIDYPIKFAGALEEPSEVADIVVAERFGVPVYVRDVATVIDGLAPPKTIARASLDGAPSANALTLSIYKKEGGDVTKIAKAVRDRLTELQQGMLSGADVVVSFDTGELVSKDLKELSRVGLETVLLVLLVLVLTIGWRESLVAALSIPLSFVIAFIGLYISGNTINFVSLFSLILAIGILVDSGIVVTEAIHTRSKKYGNSSEAAVAAIKEYAWPLIAGTMTTIAVFAPLFFLSGVMGKYVASIPFTVIFVLVASIVVALGMVPLLAIALTKESHSNRFEELQERYFQRVQDWYKRFLGRFLDSHRSQNWLLGLMVAGLFVAVLLPVFGLVKVQFFPQADEDFAYIEIERPQGTPLLGTDKSAREVEEFLYANPYIDSFVTTVGAGSSFNASGGGAGTKIANITLTLDKDRDITSSEVVEMLRRDLSVISSADVRVEEPASGPPSAAPIAIKFKGDDLDELAAVALRAEALLSSIEGTVDARSSVRDDGTQFTIAVDRTKAAQVGLSATQVAQTLRTAVSGTVATTIKKQDSDIDVTVKLNLNPGFINPEETTIASIDSIKQIPIMTPSGPALMGSLISITADESRAAISHEDQKRVVSVTSKLVPGVTALEVVGAFNSRIDELALPADVILDFGGESEDVNRSFAEMGIALIAGMALMLAILVLEFNSFRYPIYLLGIVPLSLIGVLAGLALTGKPLSFPSMLGVIALAGVIINHAIILLDSVLHMLRADSSASLRSVLVEASAIRLRPIALTTATTVIGMLPLAGASAMWGPLAFAIMFGLMFAMILTLILVPVLFYRYPGKEFAPMKR
jgi:multidrug efflux pump